VASSQEQDTLVTAVERKVPLPAHNDCLVVIYAKEKSRQGRRHDLVGKVLRIGRESANDIVLDDVGVSRTHARIERRADGWVLMDVGSTNGTLLNNQKLSRIRALENGDQLRFGSVILKYLSGADIENAFHEEIYRLTILDNLTGLANRREFDDVLAREFARARRYGRRFSVLTLDIDYFKTVNDTFGHPRGDDVLMELGRLIKARLRANDLAARLGGEEFALILPETELAGAATVAEQLRAETERIVVASDSKEIKVTISIGCAELGPADHDGVALFRRSDEKLYEAKSGGRNRIAW
jgi:two-component system cell cycle response regulator